MNYVHQEVRKNRKKKMKQKTEHDNILKTIEFFGQIVHLLRQFHYENVILGICQLILRKTEYLIRKNYFK